VNRTVNFEVKKWLTKSSIFNYFSLIRLSATTYHFALLISECCRKL